VAALTAIFDIDGVLCDTALAFRNRLRERLGLHWLDISHVREILGGTQNWGASINREWVTKALWEPTPAVLEAPASLTGLGALAHVVKQGYTAIIVTARPERIRKETEAQVWGWLERYGLLHKARYQNKVQFWFRKENQPRRAGSKIALVLTGKVPVPRFVVEDDLIEVLNYAPHVPRVIHVVRHGYPNAEYPSNVRTTHISALQARVEEAMKMAKAKVEIYRVPQDPEGRVTCPNCGRSSLGFSWKPITCFWCERTVLLSSFEVDEPVLLWREEE